jgi:hypothetical protein
METELHTLILENRKKKIGENSSELVGKFRSSHIAVEELASLGYIDAVADLKEIASHEFEDCSI